MTPNIKHPCSNPEIHLLIIWSKARHLETKLINEISSKLTILEKISTSWSSNLFSENLSRFYGVKLPPNSKKETHCGTDEFLLIIAKDRNPKYEERKTSKGISIVNTNLFDLKSHLRSLTGGGHKIHATNSPEETKHDLMLLLGLSYDKYIKDHSPITIERKIHRDLTGHSTWDSPSQIFDVLNACIPYVVLRNFEELPECITLKDHDDIDFLTTNHDEMAYILNAKLARNEPNRRQYILHISDKVQLCDIRSIGDGYYDDAWQRDLLNSRIMQKNYYRPSESNYNYSLLYHALFHKIKIPDSYLEKLNSIFSTSSRTDLNIIMNDFLEKHNYKKTEPKDLSVFYRQKGISLSRSYRYIMKDLKKLVKSIIRNKLHKK